MGLLSVESRDYGGVTKLVLWTVGGARRLVDPPFKPYLYSHSWMDGALPVVCRLMSDVNTPRWVFKRSWDSVCGVEMNRELLFQI